MASRGARRSAARASLLIQRRPAPGEAAHRYPHEFSGGQRQRIGIARAMALDAEAAGAATSRSPRSTSRSRRRSSTCCAEIQRAHGVAYLFIAHDLAVVRHVSDRVAVMYLGRIVETAHARSALRRAAASLHDLAAVRGAGCEPEPGANAVTHSALRRDQLRHGSARRLPFPSPLLPGATRRGSRQCPDSAAQRARSSEVLRRDRSHAHDRRGWTPSRLSFRTRA